MSTLEFDLEGNVELNLETTEASWWKNNLVHEAGGKKRMSLVYAEYCLDVYTGDASKEGSEEWGTPVAMGRLISQIDARHWDKVRLYLLNHGWREVTRKPFNMITSERTKTCYLKEVIILVSPRH